MKNFRKLKFPIFTTIFILFFACSSSVNPEKKIAIEIANESCSYISEISSSFIVGAVSGALNELGGENSSASNGENVNMIPDYWCECYTYYISKDLMEKFTIAELREIKDDNIKKIMVLSKLLLAHKEEIKSCIEITTDEKIKNYADFERKLNHKLDN